MSTLRLEDSEGSYTEITRSLGLEVMTFQPPHLGGKYLTLAYRGLERLASVQAPDLKTAKENHNDVLAALHGLLAPSERWAALALDALVKGGYLNPDLTPRPRARHLWSRVGQAPEDGPFRPPLDGGLDLGVPLTEDSEEAADRLEMLLTLGDEGGKEPRLDVADYDVPARA